MTDEVSHIAVQGAFQMLIVQHDIILLPADKLQSHPLNRPATGIKAEQVETLKILIEQNFASGGCLRTFGWVNSMVHILKNGAFVLVVLTTEV